MESCGRSCTHVVAKPNLIIYCQASDSSSQLNYASVCEPMGKQLPNVLVLTSIVLAPGIPIRALYELEEKHTVNDLYTTMINAYIPTYLPHQLQVVLNEELLK